MHHLRFRPFKVEVSNSIHVQSLCFGKVVWNPTWCSFLHCNKVFNDVLNTEITYSNFHSQSVHHPEWGHYQQQLHNLNLLVWDGGLSCKLIILGSVLTLQKAFTYHVPVQYGNESSPHPSCRPCQQSLILWPCVTSVFASGALFQLWNCASCHVFDTLKFMACCHAICCLTGMVLVANICNMVSQGIQCSKCVLWNHKPFCK